MTLNFNTKITVDLLDYLKLHSNNLHQFNIKWCLSVSIWKISEESVEIQCTTHSFLLLGNRNPICTCCSVYKYNNWASIMFGISWTLQALLHGSKIDVIVYLNLLICDKTWVYILPLSINGFQGRFMVSMTILRNVFSFIQISIFVL